MGIISEVLVLATLAQLPSHQADMRYAVLPNTAEVRNIIGQCIQDGHCHQSMLASIRRATDNSVGIVKWRRGTFAGTLPPRLRDYMQANGVVVYDHAGILAYLEANAAAWGGQ